MLYSSLLGDHVPYVAVWIPVGHVGKEPLPFLYNLGMGTSYRILLSNTQVQHIHSPMVSKAIQQGCPKARHIGGIRCTHRAYH